MNSLFILYLIPGLFSASQISNAWASDRFKNFEDLSKHEKVGVDYKVQASNLHSKYCVLAIHGGGIEPGSEAVASAIALQTWSTYIFIAEKERHNHDLHITSTHFDDQRALEIVRGSESCISIHGFKEEAKDLACVGGLNIALRDLIAKNLRTLEPNIEVESPCIRFGGDSPANITNLSPGLGVQIELSTHLRKQLMEDQTALTRFAHTVRSAVESYTKK